MKVVPPQIAARIEAVVDYAVWHVESVRRTKAGTRDRLLAIRRHIQRYYCELAQYFAAWLRQDCIKHDVPAPVLA